MSTLLQRSLEEKVAHQKGMEDEERARGEERGATLIFAQETASCLRDEAEALQLSDRSRD